MPKAEKDSKAELVNLTGRSPSAIREWLLNLKDNCEAYAKQYSNPDYLCFKDYKPEQRKLTPKQLKVFKLHYGYDDEAEQNPKSETRNPK